MKRINRFKKLQLALLILSVIVFIVILFTNFDLRLRLYTDRGVLFLCCYVWLIFIYSTVCIIVDMTLFHDLQKENLEVNSAAYTDSLTGIPNRYSCDLYLEQLGKTSAAQKAGCIMLELTTLNQINSASGYDEGNMILMQFASLLSKTAQEYGFAARNGGNKFVVIMQNCTRTRVEEFLSKLDFSLATQSVFSSDNNFSYRCGYALNIDEQKISLTELLSIANTRLLQDNN